MDRRREILVGKLAIGRRAMTREDAVRCFHAARGEPFWEVAVRDGLLARDAAEALVACVDTGELVCRGTCGTRRALATLDPAAVERCPSCGGPVYYGTGKADPATQATIREKLEIPPPGSERFTASTRMAGANGDAAKITVPLPIPALSEGSAAGFVPTKTFTDAGAPDTGEVTLRIPPTRPSNSAVPIFAPVPPTVPSIEPGGDTSLPSAIPLSGRTPPPSSQDFRDAETKDGVPAKDPDFVPFSIGSYDVLALLGRGGMGTVFRARQRALKRLVALKVLTLSAEDQRRRFDREIKATALLNHPNIVKVLGGGVVSDGGERSGQPYFAMEFVDGRDLVAWSRERPRTPGECALMVATLCDAMHFAHGKGIVHRDLKPQNVLVAWEGDVPKICDFGLAKVQESNLTRTGDIMGTPQYMPPEQIMGDKKRVGAPTDVYALGAILYHLLTGVPPFNAKKMYNLVAMVIRDPPLPPSQKNAAVPPALEAVVLRALAKDPDDRQRSALELGQQLRALRLP